MPMNCPNCLSAQIETKDYAKKAAATVGFLGGTASGIASARNGAEIGSIVGGSIGCIAGPTGSRVGKWIGALVGGMVGGITGALTGAQLGHVIDERLFDNYHCLACDHHFRTPLAFDRQETETTPAANDVIPGVAPPRETPR
ncbi:hypothetical protein [uncultured Propionivibrio sp.]|uniref:hypothetical protein n=1 Tax=uncultured Propionivibrio sp. TaxID=426737 RepID=UPI0029C087A6|nr:hypothetical protein [uncultured Propionivibrio sp.]